MLPVTLRKMNCGSCCKTGGSWKLLMFSHSIKDKGFEIQEIFPTDEDVSASDPVLERDVTVVFLAKIPPLSKNPPLVSSHLRSAEGRKKIGSQNVLKRSKMRSKR